MPYIVLSGLPGSGKSPLARRLAPALELPMLDKDDILGVLFDALGTGDASWRTKLSRSADEIFSRLAPTLGAGLLVSWWRHPRALSESGTPTHWLSQISPNVLEIHCVCPPQIAAARFVTRNRHPGHLDALRTLDTVIEEFEQLALLGPLAYGPVAYAATDTEVALDDLIAFARSPTNVAVD